MMTRRRWLQAASLAALPWLGLGLSPLARAHRSHVVLTRLSLNRQAGTWEWLHEIHYHDAIVALGRLLPGREVDPVAAEGRARLAFELDRTVRFIGPDGKTLAASMVGGELEGNDLVLYQEAPAPLAKGQWRVESTFLQRIFDDVIHNVSIDLGGPVRLLRLDAANPRAAFEV
jgi:hypothetical protein